MDQPFLNPGLKQLSGLRGCNRMAKIMALSLAAPVALKELELRAGFHPLCNYPLIQAVGDINHGAHNASIARVLSDFLHKRLIQL